jgi:NADH:ubiquinone reductase (H+-translocating)
MKRPQRIVIIGGGFAGTTVARHLERHFRRSHEVEITLLDSENFFTFTPLLPEVPSGSIQPKHIVFPLRALLRKTQVRQAEVQSIDLERRQVTARHCAKCGHETLSFDHLVLALGSVPNFFGTPGASEHALTIKSLADATKLHANVIDQLEHADLTDDPEARRRMLTFVVAGGGFAGVETIAELNDFVRGAGRYYPRIDPKDIRVVLIHSGPRILPEVSESLSAYALGKLEAHGVEVRLQTRVKACRGHDVLLSTGEAVPTSTFVWAAGVAPSPILDRMPLPRTAQGKLDVEATMAVKGMTGVWAVGDSAAIPDLVTGRTCPPTAQYALRQGRQLAENIAAAIRGENPGEFRHRSQGLLAGLGRRCAVAEIFGLKFSGFFAWWLWRTIYLMKLPGLERKVRVALDWTLDLFFPRDIVYLRPLHAADGPNVEASLTADGEVQVCRQPPLAPQTVADGTDAIPAPRPRVSPRQAG